MSGTLVHGGASPRARSEAPRALASRFEGLRDGLREVSREVTRDVFRDDICEGPREGSVDVTREAIREEFGAGIVRESRAAFDELSGRVEAARPVPVPGPSSSPSPSQGAGSAIRGEATSAGGRLRATRVDSARGSGQRSPEEEAQLKSLWREYRRLRTEVLRNQLILHYMTGHVRRIASRLHAGLPEQVDIEDLVQEGYIGLIDAMERFDVDRHVRFETFSGRRIFGAMQDYLRQIDPAPRLTRTRTKKLDRVVEQFQATLGRAPDIDELRDALDVPERALRRLVLEGRPGAMVPFSSVRPDGDDGDDESDAMDAFMDHDQCTPLSHVEHEDLRWFVVKGLTRRDQLILILYYYEQMTMRDIGATLGISESRVSQRLDAIHGCLRARFAFDGGEEEFV